MKDHITPGLVVIIRILKLLIVGVKESLQVQWFPCHFLSDIVKGDVESVSVY